jgi:hypothetical protein
MHVMSASCRCNPPSFLPPCCEALHTSHAADVQVYAGCVLYADKHKCTSAAAAAKPKPKPKAPAAERKPASEAKAPKSEAERALLKNESIVKREVEQEQAAAEQKAHKQQTKAAAAKMHHNDLVNQSTAA